MSWSCLRRCGPEGDKGRPKGDRGHLANITEEKEAVTNKSEGETLSKEALKRAAIQDV